MSVHRTHWDYKDSFLLFACVPYCNISHSDSISTPALSRNSSRRNLQNRSLRPSIRTRACVKPYLENHPAGSQNKTHRSARILRKRYELNNDSGTNAPYTFKMDCTVIQSNCRPASIPNGRPRALIPYAAKRSTRVLLQNDCFPTDYRGFHDEQT